MLDVRSVLRILAGNIKRTGLPIPASPSILYEWSEGLGLEDKGDTILYTGGLYQLLPYIEEFSNYLEKLEGGKTGGLVLKALGKIGKLADLSKIVVKPSQESLEHSRSILRSIIELMDTIGVRVAYPKSVDSYSGVLLYDMGLDRYFEEHARKVASKLVETGAETVITVDPHTTHVLRSVFPKIMDGFNLEVKSYLEILVENIDNLSFQEGGAETVVIHDPCFYARYEGVISEPRILLKKAGYRIVEPRRNGRLTYCCGGPIESIAPRLSLKIAETRARELVEEQPNIVTVMCPICYSNLKKAFRRIGSNSVLEDLSLLLYRRLQK